MSRVIWKYALGPGITDLAVPGGSRVLHVAPAEPGAEGPAVWIEHDRPPSMASRHFPDHLRPRRADARCAARLSVVRSVHVARLRTRARRGLRGAEVTDRSAFPDAPPGSYVTEQGWLVVGDQAWTAEEWNSAIGLDYRRRFATGKRQVPRRYATDAEREAAKQRSRRAYRERQKAASR